MTDTKALDAYFAKLSKLDEELNSAIYRRWYAEHGSLFPGALPPSEFVRLSAQEGERNLLQLLAASGRQIKEANKKCEADKVEHARFVAKKCEADKVEHARHKEMYDLCHSMLGFDTGMTAADIRARFERLALRDRVLRSQERATIVTQTSAT